MSVATWLLHSGVGVFIALAALYSATAALIGWICFRPAWRSAAMNVAGVVPPFFAGPVTIFALMMGFLASDVWQRDRLATHALMDERDGLATMYELSDLVGASGPRLRTAVRDYVTSVLRDEWPEMERQTESMQTARILDTILHLVADRMIGQSSGEGVQDIMLSAAARVAGARSSRLALSANETDRFKWAMVLLLGVLGQIGVAVVHLERRRPHVVAQCIFTTSAIIALGLIGVSEEPFHGTRQISAAPLEHLQARIAQ